MVSVITIEANRWEHLEGVLWGLEKNQSVGEWIVVHMAGETRTLHSEKFPIRQVSLASTDDLPLAAARNCGAAKAKFDTLVFLDVDCIPAADLIRSYKMLLEKSDELVNGLVAYLPKLTVPERRDFEVMVNQGKVHPVRASLKDGFAKQDQYSLFWSLNFAVLRTTFSRLGGFDETYIGYGGEDTDFAWQARKHEVPLRFTSAALAFHQWHPSNDLPVHHRRSIVNNANSFFTKWGKPAMEGWLLEFERLGYVIRCGPLWKVVK